MTRITYLANHYPRDEERLDLADDPAGIQYMATRFSVQPARQSAPAMAPAAKPAAKPEPTEAELRKIEGAEFIRLFSEKDGTAWFCAGHSIDDAVRLFGQKQIDAAEVLKSNAQRVSDGLKRLYSDKLTTFSAATPPRAVAKKSTVDLGQPISDSLTKFAKSIKFAKAK